MLRNLLEEEPMRFLFAIVALALCAFEAHAQPAYTSGQVEELASGQGYTPLASFGSEPAPVRPSPPAVAPERPRVETPAVRPVRMAPSTGQTYIIDPRIRPDVCAQGGLTMTAQGCVIRSDRRAIERSPASQASYDTRDTRGWRFDRSIDRRRCTLGYGRPRFADGERGGYLGCEVPPDGLARWEVRRRR